MTIWPNGATVRMVPRTVLLDRLLAGFPIERIHRDSRAVGVVGTPGQAARRR